MPNTEEAEAPGTAWATFENLTKGIKGVNSVGGIINVDPGQTSRPLEITEVEGRGLDKTGWFKITGVGGPGDTPPVPKGPEDGSEENSTAHRDGNPVKTATADDIARAALEGGGMSQPDDFDAMTNDQLREFLTERDERAPHPATGRPKLLAKAREGSDDAEDEGV